MQKCASSSRLGPATLRRCPSSSRRAPHFFRSFHRRPCPPPADRRTYSKSLGGSSRTVSSTSGPERAARPCSCRQENDSRRRERNAIMRIYTRLYEPCHAAGAGDWRGNAAPRMSAPEERQRADQQQAGGPDDEAADHPERPAAGPPPRELTRAGDLERGRARSQNVRPKSQKLPVNQKKVFPPVRFSTAPPLAPRGRSRPK